MNTHNQYGFLLDVKNSDFLLRTSNPHAPIIVSNNLILLNMSNEYYWYFSSSPMV